MKARLSPKEWRMLSDYLDGQFAPQQRSTVEQRLRASPQLQQALKDLQTTRALLRNSPRRRVPHNFILTPDMVGRRQQSLSSWFPAFGVTSVLAALVTVAIVLFEFLPSLTAQPVAMTAPTAQAAEALTQKEAPSGELEPSPPVIYWGGPPPASEYPLVEGRGGGCENCDTTPSLADSGQPETAPSITGAYETVPPPAAPQEEAAEQPSMEISSQTSSAPEKESLQENATSLPSQQRIESPTSTETRKPSTSEAEGGFKIAQGTETAINPILGLETGGEQATPTPFPTIEPAQVYETKEGLGIIPYITALIALLSGLAAWIIWKRSKQ